jgi:hypothetical protein
MQTGSRNPESQRFSSISLSPCKLLLNSATDSFSGGGKAKTRLDVLHAKAGCPDRFS